MTEMPEAPGAPACAELPVSMSPILYFLIFLSGMSYSLLGSLLPDVADLFSLSRTQASSLPLAQFAGDFFGLILLGFMFSRPRALLVGSAIALCLSALAIGAAPGFSLAIKAAFFAYGASLGIMATLPGLMASRLAPGRSARAMNTLYGFFSAGVMVAPVAAGALLAAGVHYRSAFLALGALAGAAALATAIARAPCPGLGDGLKPGAVRGLWRDHRSLFIVIALMNFLYVGAETVPNAWMPKYLHDTFPGSAAFRATLALSLFWAAITAGRFICASLIRRGARPQAMLAAIGLPALACLVIAPLARHRLPAEAAFIAAGFFFSGMFPIIISYCDRLPENELGAMFILVMAMGMAGAAGAGRGVGVIADKIGFPAGMGVAAVLTLLVLLMVPLLGRTQHPSRQAEKRGRG
ncbi:MAG TPA: MFS transporter [bacterium]|nr:MFS transporter [bacterium]